MQGQQNFKFPAIYDLVIPNVIICNGNSGHGMLVSNITNDDDNSL
jgi:hypothetical protein